MKNLLLTLMLMAGGFCFAQEHQKTDKPQLTIEGTENGIVDLVNLQKQDFPKLVIKNGSNFKLITYEVTIPSANGDIQFAEDGDKLKETTRAALSKLTGRRMFAISKIVVEDVMTGKRMQLEDQRFKIRDKY